MNTLKRLITTTAVLALTLAGAGTSQAAERAGQVQLELSLGQPVLLADQVQRTWVKVGLEGLPLGTDVDRVPLNVALVLDRSGSMAGEKLRQAKQAALTALDYLESDDIFSLVVYDSNVRVLIPASPVGDREDLRDAIRSIRSRGNTALFAGVSKGAAQLRRYLDDNRVNRVVLLSDGLANVGPSTPDELGRLGRRLAREGIAVTTIGLGLGYNEDLMVQLAGNSDGNHTFVEEASDLAGIFRSEFGELGTVVAQDLVVIIRCAPGVRPLRLLGRDGEISSNRVVVRLNQLYAMQEKYLTLEVEVPAGRANSRRPVASVELDWDDLGSRRRHNASAKADVEYTVRAEEVEEKADADVMASVASQRANVVSKQALKLRDAGRVEEAEGLLKRSARELEQDAVRYAAPALKAQAADAAVAGEAIKDEASWGRTRKELRSKQYKVDRQQSY